MRKLNVLIAGSTGYMGVQLIKLLLKHQNINIKYLWGNSSVGKKISFYDSKLINKKLPKIKEPVPEIFLVFNSSIRSNRIAPKEKKLLG